jgi:hypothetical protein
MIDDYALGDSHQRRGAVQVNDRNGMEARVVFAEQEAFVSARQVAVHLDYVAPDGIVLDYGLVHQQESHLRHRPKAADAALRQNQSERKPQ